MKYREFLESKICVAPDSGFKVEDSEINPALKPHQCEAVKWALKGGRRALFESFGLGKTVQELEFCRLAGKNKIPKGLSSDVFTAMSYIRGHVDSAISVQDVADATHRSPSFITQQFRKELGITPGAFISRCKLEEAKSLLLFSDKSLAEISSHLCYSSQGYFQNVFKKKFGMTPLQYRNTKRRIE